MEDAPGEPGIAEVPATMALQPEAGMLSVWRRILIEGSAGPSLPDAATLLSTSLESVQQRIEAGDVQALRDDAGRIRISASFVYTPTGEVASDTSDSIVIARLWSELKLAREELDASRANEARLQEELDALELALEYTKGEVANLWRVMTTRNLKQAARRAVHDLQENPRIITLSEQRAHIRAKVTNIREIARRRKWPWSLVS